LLQGYADNQLQNERIIAALQGYRKSEPGQELNEMHSMFGTEIVQLPAELESYYSQYFLNRQKVVAAANAYQAAFTSRQTSIKQYDAQLEELNNRIKSDTQQLNDMADTIDRDRRQLDAYRDSGNIEAYNNGVEPFNVRVNTYNLLLESARSRINQYNALVKERNDIAAQTIELQQAIDSSDLPQSQ
jgi:predicted  nucleic acid-binding Zn-ribbon protein